MRRDENGFSMLERCPRSGHDAAKSAHRHSVPGSTLERDLLLSWLAASPLRRGYGSLEPAPVTSGRNQTYWIRKFATSSLNKAKRRHAEICCPALSDEAAFRWKTCAGAK